jgi:hypothetical protein
MKILTLILLTGICAGCANPWKSNFQPNPELEGQHFAATDSAAIRTLEYERLQRYSEAERKMRVESSVAPEDLPAADKLAAKNRLLETLQIPERGDQIELLGWSEFTTEERLDPHDGKLDKFARSIGGDYAVVASEFTGKTVRTVDRPISSYSTAFGGPSRHHGRVSTVNTTTWVPVNVIEDQFVYEVAFLRKTRK